MPLVYFGAVLSGLRSGRWYGSRFLPLGAAIAALLCAQLVLLQFSMWGLSLAIALVAEAGIIAAIADVMTSRDFG
jgi:hypothetical protein